MMRGVSSLWARFCTSSRLRPVLEATMFLTTEAVPILLSICMWVAAWFVYTADHPWWSLVGLLPACGLSHRLIRLKRVAAPIGNIYLSALFLMGFVLVIHTTTGGVLRIPEQSRFVAAIEISDIYHVQDDQGNDHRDFTSTKKDLHDSNKCPKIEPVIPSIGDADYVWHKKYFTQEAALLAGHHLCLNCLGGIWVVPFLLDGAWHVADKIIWVWRLVLALPLEVLHRVITEYLSIWIALLVLCKLFQRVFSVDLNPPAPNP